MGDAATLAIILAVIIMLISRQAEKANGEERIY